MNKYILLFLLGVLIASLSQILLKKSSMKPYSSKIKEYMNPYVICGYGMLGISTILTILAFHGLDYKNGPMLETLGYPLILVLSWVFFKEKITFKKVIGNFLIIVGIIIFYS